MVLYDVYDSLLKFNVTLAILHIGDGTMVVKAGSDALYRLEGQYKDLLVSRYKLSCGILTEPGNPEYSTEWQVEIW